MTLTAPLLAILVLGSCAAAPVRLGHDGVLKQSVSDADIQGAVPRLQDPSARTAAAETILRRIFGDNRNPDLADMLVYFPAEGDPSVPILMYRGEAVRVLNREPVMWIVVLAEPAQAGHAVRWKMNGDSCPEAKVRITEIGETRPDLVLSVTDAFKAVLSGHAQDTTTKDPGDFTVPTHRTRLDGGLCWGMQRLSLEKDSFNRVTVSLQLDKDDDESEKKSDEKPGAAKKPSGGQEPARPPAPANAEPDSSVQEAHESAKRDSPRQEIEDANRFWRPPMSIMNFANSRTPLHLASVAVGSDLYNFGSANGCWTKGGCTPTLYVFGHLLTAQAPGSATWIAQPRWTLSLVTGVRILDPVLGEVVFGGRAGVEEGASQALARFGLIVGMGYQFPSIGSDGKKSGNNWRAFTGLDFAF